MDDHSFDLRYLKAKESLSQNGTGELYLGVENGQNLILVNGENSYYEINELADTTLRLTCFFENSAMNSGPIKLVTFELTRLSRLQEK
jgi:hypothetical protein